MTISQANIESRIISIIAKCTDLPFSMLKSTHWNEPLTGRKFNLFETDLVYILLEIEQEFEIQIPQDFLEQYGFSTIGGICSSVFRVLEQSD